MLFVRLGLTVQDPYKKWQFYIWNVWLTILLYSLNLSINIGWCTICTPPENEWLIVNRDGNKLFQITNHGQFKIIKDYDQTIKSIVHMNDMNSLVRRTPDKIEIFEMK
ncbi:unnamed protein product [Didymodactylos carnosus]|uniref:Uncharacterized protein n=1 Tax=Didymodactylos carnosus TaxID=1234261 RepID=A0A8S2J178_9BILA|nr:unnamed protein product [Didymodactylos carnosus]CAF3774031.1 unnamed protein product [Didymodactylos carnosus]